MSALIIVDCVYKLPDKSALRVNNIILLQKYYIKYLKQFINKNSSII